MNKVTVTINHHDYPIICGEGQEQRVRDLAQMIDTKATQIAAAAPHTGEAMILVLSGLMLADEIQELQQQLSGADDTTAIKLEMLADRLLQAAQSLEDGKNI